MRSFYVYALLEAVIPAPRVRGHKLQIVEVAGVFAAGEYLATAPSISERVLRSQHEIVVRLGRSADALLPARFGALVDIGELGRVIRLRRATLARGFRQVRGKQQMTVRVFGRARRPRPKAARSGTEYLLARVASAHTPLPPAARAICDAVAPLASAERIDPPFRGVQVTLHHLVRRGDAARYVAAVEASLAGLKVPPHVVISGPWPPFAFAPDLWSPELLVGRGKS